MSYNYFKIYIFQWVVPFFFIRPEKKQTFMNRFSSFFSEDFV